ncbi:MAG: hypothetical protein K0Q70_49 [Rhodospirillales bacterium]|jgi:hypothetical protein|nr:hypothetical protein [Rhodospirillales bacterium]
MTKNSPATPTKDRSASASRTAQSDSSDRRQMKYGIAFKTAGSAGQIGDLLEKHCSGQWHIILCDLETENGVKELKVMFELEKDKNTFKQVVTGPQKSAA